MMIPSDHFVMFYNEMFKFLEEQGDGELRKYYDEISRHQEIHCLELFKTKGLQGMYEYWDHIRIEENCGLELELQPGRFTMRMTKCPSLGKILHSDGGPAKCYCLHCAGWIAPIMTKAGFYYINDLISLTEPVCDTYVFESREEAEKCRAEILKLRNNNSELVASNF